MQEADEDDVEEDNECDSVDEESRAYEDEEGQCRKTRESVGVRANGTFDYIPNEFKLRSWPPNCIPSATPSSCARVHQSIKSLPLLANRNQCVHHPH